MLVLKGENKTRSMLTANRKSLGKKLEDLFRIQSASLAGVAGVARVSGGRLGLASSVVACLGELGAGIGLRSLKQGRKKFD